MILFKRKKPDPALAMAEAKRKLERELKARGYSNSEAKREVARRYEQR